MQKKWYVFDRFNCFEYCVTALAWIATLSLFAGIGVMLAWRG